MKVGVSPGYASRSTELPWDTEEIAQSRWINGGVMEDSWPCVSRSVFLGDTERGFELNFLVPSQLPTATTGLHRIGLPPWPSSVQCPPTVSTQ